MRPVTYWCVYKLYRPCTHGPSNFRSQLRYFATSGDKPPQVNKPDTGTSTDSSSGNSPGTGSSSPQPSQTETKEESKAFKLSTGEIVEAKDIKRINKTFEEARLEAQKMYEERRKQIGDTFGKKLESLRSIFSGEPNLPRTPDEEWYYRKVSFWMKRYENFVGLTDVKAAQARVVESQKKFILMQEKRREAQALIGEVQKRIKEIHLELEKTSRGEDRYLVLVTQEHQVLKEERGLMEEFRLYEKGEREEFNNLSNSVRDSHEKERAQAEKTKYWSVLGSIIGTCIGIIGTTINNRLRMRELRQLVMQNSTVDEIKAIGDDLSTTFVSHQQDLKVITDEVQTILRQTSESLGHVGKVDNVLSVLTDTSEKINVKALEDSLRRLQERQDYLSQVIAKHEQLLDEKIGEIKSDIFVQNNNVGKLAHIQLKDRERDQKLGEQRETLVKKSFEGMKQQQQELLHTLAQSSREIDEKMKDIRSLLLTQHQLPKFDSKIVERLGSLEKKLTVAAASSSTGGGLARTAAAEDQLVAVLESHHRQTRQTVVMSTLLAAILTPIAIYSVNNLL